jgi:glycosyltransferase involved in cell wall biosynthesis
LTLGELNYYVRQLGVAAGRSRLHHCVNMGSGQGRTFYGTPMSGRIKILSVFHEVGWAGDESRTLSMIQTMNHECFEHMVVTVLDMAPEEDLIGFHDREKQFAQAGAQIKRLSAEIPERKLKLGGVAGKLYAKTRVLRRARRLAKLAKQWEADLIDARTAASFVGVLAAKMAGVPSCVTLYHGPLEAGGTVWPWTKTVAVRLADRVLTDSRIRADEFRASLSRNRDKVLLIPNGIPEPKSQYESQQARKLLNLPENSAIRVVGQIGRIVPYKGQTVFLHAARKILDCEPNVVFLIVGYGSDRSYRNALEKLAADLELGDNSRIISYPGPIGDVWAAIDIHVHASLFDSQPIAVIEGMSLGKPAVVTSVGGVPDMVEHGRTGLIVPPGDPVSLASAVLEILGNSVLMKDLGKAARERYENNHRPELMARRLEELFLELTNRPRNGQAGSKRVSTS